MGSFLSSLLTPPPLAADDGESAVVAVHSKAAWDQQWEAHRNASKLVSHDVPPFNPLLSCFSGSG
jgi:thioredoxin 1